MTEIAIKIFSELHGNPTAWVLLLSFLFISFLPKALSFLSAWKAYRSDQHELLLRKLSLEIEKLQLEIDNLKPPPEKEDIFINYADRPMFSRRAHARPLSKIQKVIYKTKSFLFGSLSAICWLIFAIIGFLFLTTPLELALSGTLSWSNGLALQLVFIIIAVATYNGGNYFLSLHEKYGATNA